jgi:aldehyde dehydrogenase (NAD+)
MKQYNKFYIDGQWVDPIRSTDFQLFNPATEQPFATVSLGSAEDVDKAVAAARRAFETFGETSKEERIALLQRIADGCRAREEDLMAAISTEMGAPRSLKMHVDAAIGAIKQAIITIRDYELESKMGVSVVRKEPIGVCGLVTAWNLPLQLVATKVCYALAAGCTVVVKPSEFTPVCALIFAEIVHAAGAPKGVFNLINGDGPTVGDAISRHPGIDMVSFTGSTRAGIQVAQAASSTVKRVSQELGGKSANIVLQDANLEAAARYNIERGFLNTAQSCHAPSRLLVHESQLDEVLGLLVNEVQKIRVGDPQNPATTMGPVVNKSQFDRIQKYITSGLEEGARLVCGGQGRPEGMAHGYFVQPTIFADVEPTMTIAREEIFGPVLSVMTYSTVAEAIEIANDSAYGLGAYVFSSDLAKGTAVGAKLRAGRVFYNGAPGNPVAPMGGYKQSGNGRAMGVFGLEEYLEVKAMIGFDEAAPA